MRPLQHPCAPRASRSRSTHGRPQLHAPLQWGAECINLTGQDAPDWPLAHVAHSSAALVLTYMPYGNTYEMRSRSRVRPPEDQLGEVIEFVEPRAEAAGSARVANVIVDPNFGIVQPATTASQKIHRQLETVWGVSRPRTLSCPLLMYAARKLERSALRARFRPRDYLLMSPRISRAPQASAEFTLQDLPGRVLRQIFNEDDSLR